MGKITKPINMPHHRRVPCLISLSQHGDFSELHFDSVVRGKFVCREKLAWCMSVWKSPMHMKEMWPVGKITKQISRIIGVYFSYLFISLSQHTSALHNILQSYMQCYCTKCLGKQRVLNTICRHTEVDKRLLDHYTESDATPQFLAHISECIARNMDIILQQANGLFK